MTKGTPLQTEPAIHVHELSYTYPSGSVALSNVSFQIAPGESVGLIGPNGAGKTTLFLCLSGVLPVRAKSVQLAGLDPADPACRKLLPAKLGIVFQHSDDQLFNSTVFDDVAFGPLNLGLDADEVRRRVAESLERVGLTGFDHKVPLHMSAGEKRRAAIAGVLAMRPEILLLDEPSTHLDPRGRRELIHLMNGLHVTKVISAHDLEMIRETCQRILLLDQGRIMADGPTRKILADAALMNAHGLEVPHSLTPHVEQHHQTERG
jgi:cobalt/nickel transport system ATP-binding protein